jgi:extradiol dioxygenase family protein
MAAQTLFHFSFAIDDLERARAFYGGLLGCPEGRKMKGRIDYNFFGHHIVGHLAPEEVVGEKGRKVGGDSTPLRHFGVVTTLEDFQRIADLMTKGGADFINQPAVKQKGTVREQMLMTVRDGCGNAIEFKGLRNIGDVYNDA